jgi:Phosphate-selective porin O and P
MIHRSIRRQTLSASLVISLFVLAVRSGGVAAQTQPVGGDQPPEQTPAQPAAPDDGTRPAVVRPATLFPTMGPTNELVLGENFFIRPGLLLQGWSELMQDRVVQPDGEDGDYQWNTYLRRARIFFAGGVFKKVTYLLLLEAANLGRTTTEPDGTTSKAFDTLVFQDAFLSLNVHQAFSIQAGLMLSPFSRNILQSTSTYTSLDILATSATFLTSIETSALRDTGVQVKGQLLGDRLEYRLGAFQGIRQDSEQEGAAGGKNPPRFLGYLQYNFLDTETGYVFNGMYFGKKRVLGVAGGFDYQRLDGPDVEAYWAVSASAFLNYPLAGASKEGGDEISALVQWLHFDPGTTVAEPPAGFADQDDIAGELGYYNKALKGSVFGKVELRMHEEEMFEASDLRIYGGGLKYFLAEAAANVTLAYNRIETPNAPEAALNPVNQLVMQLQLAYY